MSIKIRLKCIDTFRGLSMLWMFLGHLTGWWLKTEDFWLAEVIFAIMDPLGASAFLFIAGISTMFSYRSRCKKVELNDDYHMKLVKNEYLFRTLFIFLISIIYNVFIAITLMSLIEIWKWFILLTMAFSLLITWPLLKTSKLFRIFIGASVWIANQYILIFLVNFRGQPNVYGVLFHLLYNSLDLDPLLSFFSFFLFGTVFGDILNEINSINEQGERKKAIKNHLLIPVSIIGLILIISGVGIQLNLNFDFGHTTMIHVPDFLLRGSFSWMLYTLGIIIIFLSVLFSIEQFELIKTEKNYKFLFYFSYYSFTIFLSHNLLYFLFLNQLNACIIWPFVTITTILIGLLFRFIYNKWGVQFSLKAQLGRLATRFAFIIEEMKRG